LQYFTNLQSLKLDYNQFEQTIPAVFGGGSTGRLNNLSVLSVSGNQLTGKIPFSIYQLLNLQRLNLEKNQLSGTIAPEIENLKNLTR